MDTAEALRQVAEELAQATQLLLEQLVQMAELMPDA